MTATRIQLDAVEQADQVAQQAASVLAGGGLVVFPTETVYGVAALATSDKAMRALTSFRPAQPYTIHLASPDDAGRYADTSAPALQRFLHKAFPGPVTVVLEVDEDQAQQRLQAMGVPAELGHYLYAQGIVSLRCPGDPLARLLLQTAGRPVVATGANPPSQGHSFDADTAEQALGSLAELVIDGGPSPLRKPSTVVRVKPVGNDLQLTMLRTGVYDERYIRKLMRFTVLLVCSGNTCRSPMAEGIARQILASSRKLPVDELENAGIRVISAGTFANAGMPAADQAISVMRRWGVDLAKHRSRPITAELVHEADVIFCMSRSHLQALLSLSPAAASKTFLLDPSGDIADPVGSDEATYELTARAIRAQLEKRLKEQRL